MRLIVGIVALGAVVAGIASIAASGCTNPLPENGYCELGNLAAVTNTSQVCLACLNKTPQCCDLYGGCQEAGDGCPELAASELRCVVDAGTLGRFNETACLSGGSDASAAAYGCVKDNCAEACGISAAVCRPDPAIPTVIGAKCDNCTTNKCCTGLNACYQSRPCKIAFDCLLGCGSQFKALFDTPDAAAAIQKSATHVCSGVHAMMDEIFFDEVCIRGCVFDYILPQEGGAVDPSGGVGCAALSLLNCAYSNCQPECATPPDAGD